MLKLEYKPYTLDFTFDAGTSRGVMKKRDVWFLKVCDDRNPEVAGYGEVAPLNRLSIEDVSLVPDVLEQVQQKIVNFTTPRTEAAAFSIAQELSPIPFASLRFGLEVALLDLVHGGQKLIFDNAFYQNQEPIPINGLVWMGDIDTMKQRAQEKLDQGFKCIKMKIGALDFQQELEVLKLLREVSVDLELRVDANGAFANHESLRRLLDLSEFNLHSIEQPIIPRQPEAMQLLCKKGAVKIALDEELIGIATKTEKRELLEFLKPHYIVLKPSLIGGFQSAQEWIDLAEEMKIGWWITSALESNIGLNAIAQFTAGFKNHEYHGLGTGQLYHNNIDSPLTVENGLISYTANKDWGAMPL
ncbi:MAG: o-succinylbenzoate synthase [Cytophagales bacterium]|nr:o-succinylbenzoate synthase [Cytophagales bacterium]